MYAWLKSRIVGSPLERLTRRLYIRLDPSPASRYDRLTLAVMRRHLMPDSNCIDVGAHRGTILAEMVQLAPRGTHFAFEPVPEHSQYLVRSFPMVQVHQLALSNVRQQTTFVHDRHHPTRSSFRRNSGSDAAEDLQTITVQTDLLDNVIPSTLPIRLIKIDVEGAEYQVLQGAFNTIRTNRPVIIFEHTFEAEEIYGASSEAIYDFLTVDCGLQISLLGKWLQHGKPMTRDAFKAAVSEGLTLYFMAHP